MGDGVVLLYCYEYLLANDMRTSPHMFYSVKKLTVCTMYSTQQRTVLFPYFIFSFMTSVKDNVRVRANKDRFFSRDGNITFFIYVACDHFLRSF